MIFFIAFPLFAIGCAAFLICASVPPFRRFALSSSLWFAACFPCFLVVFAGIVAINFGIDRLTPLFHRTEPGIELGSYVSGRSGILIAITTTIITFGGATAITLLHGVVIRRMTYVLFRLYVTCVSFGAGILTMFFLLMAFGLGTSLPLFAAINLLGSILSALLAWFCYLNANQFRGKYPEQFPVVTREEFG